MLTKASSSIKFGTQIVQLLVKLAHLDGFGFPSVRQHFTVWCWRVRQLLPRTASHQDKLGNPDTRTASFTQIYKRFAFLELLLHAGTRNVATQFHATCDDGS
jgi:hypothetical protein